MTSKQAPIIVKKIKKGGGGGHHGGSWKVAYADFVTAMMAFFLLMWLLNMTSDEKRVRLSYYFKHFSLFSESGDSFMDGASEMLDKQGDSKEQPFNDNMNVAPKNLDFEAGLEHFEELVKSSIVKKLEALRESVDDLKSQILIDTVNNGVRIQVVDKEGSPMFNRGSTRLTPKAKDILEAVGKTINSLENKVIIEGHTDSIAYSGREYSNWELSVERASSARKELEALGLNPKRIMRVAGYADTSPLIEDNTADLRNRRISIILKVVSTQDKTRTSTVSAKSDTKGIKVSQRFKDNKPLNKTLLPENNGITDKSPIRRINKSGDDGMFRIIKEPVIAGKSTK